MFWKSYINRLEYLRQIAHDIKLNQELADLTRQRFREYAKGAELDAFAWMADRKNAEDMITTALESAKKQAAGRMDKEVLPC